MQGDCQWPLKNDGNFYWSLEPKMHSLHVRSSPIYIWIHQWESPCEMIFWLPGNPLCIDPHDQDIIQYFDPGAKISWGLRYSLTLATQLIGGHWQSYCHQGRTVKQSIWNSHEWHIIASLYPTLQRSWKGGILVSPCPSVRLWTESCPLCIVNNTHRIHFIFAHLIKQLQKVCRV